MAELTRPSSFRLFLCIKCGHDKSGGGSPGSPLCNRVILVADAIEPATASV